MSKRFRVVAAVSLVVAVAIATAMLLGATSSTPLAREGSEHQGLAFARHTQELLNRGNKEGPASYADQVEQLNAYPAAAVTAENVATARASFAAIASRGLGRGQHSTTSWTNIGPTRSIYPAFLNRHGSDYVTSGRITALAISPTCDAAHCTVWIGAAGGGVWKSDQALAQYPNWQNVSDGYFKSGAIGSLTYDVAHNTLYAGTGELAAAGDAEAGVGIYKSTDQGATWTALAGNAAFNLRAIRDIKVSPADPTGNTLFAASGRGVHGISSTTAGSLSIPPAGMAPAYGVLRSKDGGATWEVLEPSSVGNITDGLANSFATRRGATDVAFDPSDPHTVYASAYGKGVWRSNHDGDTGTWTQIKPAQAGGGTADRTEFALARMTPTGRGTAHTRMYVTEGDSGGASNPSRFWVADDVQSGSPTFVLKTSANPADPGYATYDFCTGQCWYDQGVYSPVGQPNMVYIYGSYVYPESPDASFNNPGGISNARALLLSRDGGNTFTDLTEDATSPTAPNGLHPDQHALVTNPSNPLQFFEGSDGGLMLSDGTLADTSSRCDARGLGPVSLARCKQLLSAVPGKLTSLNAGLQTLQFQSLSVNPANSKNIQGGTQDNGTFETQGSPIIWPQTIFGDGGLSGFDATDKHFRFHTYYAQQVDVSFNDGAPPSWDWISDPLFSGESSLFYFPIISDPVVHGTMYAGLNHVWRTLDNGGSQAYLDQHCNEFTGDFSVQCGDWVPLDGLSLTGTGRGAARAGGNVSWLQRTSSDASTLWAATSLGRVFISHNADAAVPSTVTFTQLDTLAANSPGRAVSSIYVDPANSNHAWISYLGYNGNTPSTPGHVFSVTYNPIAGTATWTLLDGTGAGSIGNQPINAVVFDKWTGDLFASTDFGVVRLAASDLPSGWVLAAQDLPVVTVAGLTINPDARQLLAATHGRGAYQLTLP